MDSHKNYVFPNYRYKDFLQLQNGKVTLNDMSLKSPINMVLVAGNHADGELKQSDYRWTYSRPVLPFPVVNSPLLVYLGYNTKVKYQPTYVNSLDTVLNLRIILAAYTNNIFLDYYKQNKERIDKCTKEFMKKEQELNDTFICVVIALHKQLEKHEITVEQALQEFIATIRRYTITLINAMERCIHAVFALNIDIDYLLTPFEDENGIVTLPVPEMVGLAENSEKFFRFKQQQQNVILKKYGFPTGKWFFDSRYSDSQELFNQQRVKEYFNFLNSEDGRYGED